jgi:hypothetical protein
MNWKSIASLVPASMALFCPLVSPSAKPPCVSPCVVASDYNVVTHSVATVNGEVADIYSWFDAEKLPRTLALKQEGAGNHGHGGYAIQMTYVLPAEQPTPHYYTVTVNAEDSSDGGFGYFVSHERERWFGNDKHGNPILDSIARRIFKKDDSPLGLNTKVKISYPATSSGTKASAAERISTTYEHYGTVSPSPVDPSTGYDQNPLPGTPSSFALYDLPVTITWVVEALQDYPRIDVRIALDEVGAVDLVNFDVRGPYGVMVFDNGADGTVDAAQWGDQAFRFNPTLTPVIRDSGWDWSVPNTGARFNALIAGGYEMGLFEPVALADTKIVDGYAAERGATDASFGAAGGTSYDSCKYQTAQVLPSDGTWPYQSEQYSLPCPVTDTKAAIETALTTPATYKKMAWGSNPYFGSSLAFVYNGLESFPFDGFPADETIAYSTCVVLGATIAGGLTQTLASAYIPGNPGKVHASCATAKVK